MDTVKKVNIVGAGLSGLSAAITLARNGIACNLISSQPSERAQSVMAEGGINASMNTMGENDTIEEHYQDTMRGGCFLEAEHAVRNLTENAPDVVRDLVSMGVPFNSENGRMIQRNFGGQKKKRTSYAKSSTGKIIMSALIDEARKYEVSGLITRYPHHRVIGLEIDNNELRSIRVIDSFTKKISDFSGTTILCSGGMNGFFEGVTTGTTQNTGDLDAIAFQNGVTFANLEFIQYHPTTVGISNKRMLISEAARGEGGRLFIYRNGQPWYFMEEKYPVLKNLMPRDVVSREIIFAKQEEGCTGEVYLDMTGLDESIWKNKLSDLREEIISYLYVDPKTEPVAIDPGIHFFMGGMRVTDDHETNVRGLYAAGEAACKYHGANRLGGNSMLGAVYGGKKAASAVLGQKETLAEVTITPCSDGKDLVSDPKYRKQLKELLLEGLGIVRDRETMEKVRESLKTLSQEENMNEIDRWRTTLGLAMVESALARWESRGAHYRVDYPETDDEFRKPTLATLVNGEIRLEYEELDQEGGSR